MGRTPFGFSWGRRPWSVTHFPQVLLRMIWLLAQPFSLGLAAWIVGVRARPITAWSATKIVMRSPHLMFSLPLLAHEPDVSC